MMWGCLPLSGRKPSAPVVPGSLAVTIVIAEKGAGSTVHRNPVQGHYRSAADHEFMDPRFDRLMTTSLPFHMAEPTDPSVGGTQRINEWEWVYCGRFGRSLVHSSR